MNESEYVFRPLSELPDLGELLPGTANLIYASGPEYFDILFGGKECAVACLSRWIARTSSCFGFDRITLALAGREVAGVALHLSGDELAVRQKADMHSLLKESDSSRRAALSTNAPIIRAMTPPIEPWEYYLRSLSVDGAHRGKGLGAALLKQVFGAGRALDFHWFRLDVRSDNPVAIKLYRSAGFEVYKSLTIQQTGWELCSMRVEIKGL